VRAIDWDAIGFPAPLQLRLGGHYGPVYRAIDPILKTTTYVGAHVSRAARIEPVTPPGGVYVTEQFATKLALSHGDRFECDYVGVRDLPKNYGRLPLHLVREKHTG
jgi:class 3 adenylate cyclase